MDSPPLPPRPRSLRPWYLVVTLLLTWIIGVRGFMGGCGAAMFLREGATPDVMAVAQQARDQGDPFQFTFLVLEAAQARALSDHQRVAFPLSIGRMLLGGLLVVASGLALGGRPGGRGLALQVLAASAAFAVLDYVLMEGVRGAWIDLLVRAGELLPEGVPERESLTNPKLWWMAERVRLAVFDLGAFAAAALALAQPRARAFFDAVARAAERTEGP